MLTVGSLFSGIGGIDLDLQMTGGFETRWFCEIDPWCRRVLAKHWPDVPCYEDVTTLDFENVEHVDVICGGFPCQDISNAGRHAGIDGERSGLWSEFARAVRVVRPRFVLVENTAALTGRGLDAVLADLATCGYDAEWDCIPAAAVGAPHPRDRIWVVAYPHCQRQLQPQGRIANVRRRPSDGVTKAHADADGERHGASSDEIRAAWLAPEHGDWWATEPDVARMVHGLPGRVDRVRGLGNAVVPQVVEHIGRLILELHV